MSDQRRQLLQRSLAWSAGFIALGGVLASVFASTTQQVWNVVSGLSPSDLVLGLLLVLMNYALRAQRWRVYCASIGYRMSLRAAMTAFTAGLVGSITPGKVGEVVRSYVAERHGVPWRVSLATLLVERVSDVCSVALLALAGAAAVRDERFLWPAALILFASLVAFALFRSDVLLGLTQALPWIGPRLARRIPSEFRTLLQAAVGARVFAVTMIYGLVGWFMEVLCLALIAAALGCGLDIARSASIFGFGVLAGAASLIPGGLGATEMTMGAMLARQGCHMATAVAIALAFRVCTLWFGVLLGTICFGVHLVRRQALGAGAMEFQPPGLPPVTKDSDP